MCYIPVYIIWIPETGKTLKGRDLVSDYVYVTIKVEIFFNFFFLCAIYIICLFVFSFLFYINQVLNIIANINQICWKRERELVFSCMVILLYLDGAYQFVVEFDQMLSSADLILLDFFVIIYMLLM